MRYLSTAIKVLILDPRLRFWASDQSSGPISTFRM